MSKKRTSKTKSKKSISKNTSYIPRHIMIDYTLRDFPAMLGRTSKGVMDIVHKWAMENLPSNPSMDQMREELEKQKEKWNALTDGERKKMLENSGGNIKKDSEKLWTKNYVITRLHRSYFSNIFASRYPTSQEEKDYSTNFLKEYKIFVTDWGKFLEGNADYIVETFEKGTTRNTMAAYINLFTTAGLGIIGESYLNTIRTLWLSQGTMPDTLLNYLPKVIKYSINREMTIIKEFQKFPKSVAAIVMELEKTKTDSYKYISYNSNFVSKDNDKTSRYKILRSLWEDDQNNDENNSLFSYFKIDTEMIRAHNEELIHKIENGEVLLKNVTITDGLYETYGDYLNERIKYVRNIVLSNKKEISDIFINGDLDLLSHMCDWFDANMDKSILSGIFLLRDFFDPKDRKEIIDNALNAAIAHNTDLLTLKGIDLVNWLVLGLRH